MVTGLLESHGLIQPTGRAPSWRAIVAVASSINARPWSSGRCPCPSESVTPWPRISSPRARRRAGMAEPLQTGPAALPVAAVPTAVHGVGPGLVRRRGGRPLAAPEAEGLDVE